MATFVPSEGRGAAVVVVVTADGTAAPLSSEPGGDVAAGEDAVSDCDGLATTSGPARRGTPVAWPARSPAAPKNAAPPATAITMRTVFNRRGARAMIPRSEERRVGEEV